MSNSRSVCGCPPEPAVRNPATLASRETPKHQAGNLKICSGAQQYPGVKGGSYEITYFGFCFLISKSTQVMCCNFQEDSASHRLCLIISLCWGINCRKRLEYLGIENSSI